MRTIEVLGKINVGMSPVLKYRDHCGLVKFVPVLIKKKLHKYLTFGLGYLV